MRPRSCIIDGDAVACGDDGIALFERIRYRRHDARVFMWAFDIIELNRDVCAALPPWVGRQRRLLLLPATDIAAR
ncbi:MAG: hypothetical protein WAN75_40370 [Xanthobacteraceae bacterium]|jgi:ATP-dependent DNA ligase